MKRCLSACLATIALLITSCTAKEAERTEVTESEILEEIHYYADHDIAAGFLPLEEIEISITEILSDQYQFSGLESLVRQEVRKKLAQQLKRQESWPPETDCDRLDQAFAELEAEGIVCRQDFSDCGTCGSAEIWEEIDKAESANKSVQGYVFYHMQDTESAVNGSGLYLNYGATKEGEKEALKVANQVVEKLEEKGFDVDWDGTWEKRIGFSIDWKRRR